MTLPALDRHLAEDLVQETLAKVYVRWHRRFGARIENPAAYALTATAYNAPDKKYVDPVTEAPVLSEKQLAGIVLDPVWLAGQQ